MTDDDRDRARAASAAPAENAASAPSSMTLWGRRAARTYLIVAALALVAMLVETVLGHAGIGTMFAAILAAPWSMIAAAFLPPMPRDWPMATGLAIRMAPLALFMLLNAAIIAGIAARSERDIRGAATRVSLLLVLLGTPFLSGCILTSRQVVLVAAPVSEKLFFNGGRMWTFYAFDLTASPAWIEHRSKLAAVSDLSLMGTFTNPAQLTPPGPSMNVDIGVVPDPTPAFMTGTEVWGPLGLAYLETRRVGWDAGAKLFGDSRALRTEIQGDGRFGLIIASNFATPALGGAAIQDFHLGVVLQLK